MAATKKTSVSKHTGGNKESNNPSNRKERRGKKRKSPRREKQKQNNALDTEGKKPRIVSVEESGKASPTCPTKETEQKMIYSEKQVATAIINGMQPPYHESGRLVRELYEEIEQIWPQDKREYLEHILGALRANQYYWAHAPKPDDHGRIETLVLSESHAYTQLFSLLNDIKPEYKDKSQPGHIKLVHSLSYGEVWMLRNQMEKEGSSRGTREFWRMLATLAGNLNNERNELDPLRLEVCKKGYKKAFNFLEGSSKEKESRERVKRKAKILSDIKKAGIMFADVCPVAIYLPPKNRTFISKKTGKPYFSNINKLSSKKYKEIIKLSWEYYTSFMLEKLKPKRLVILGTSIQNAIGTKTIRAECAKVGTLLLPPLHHPSYNRVRGYHYRGYLRVLRAIGNGDEACARTCYDEMDQFIPSLNYKKWDDVQGQK